MIDWCIHQKYISPPLLLSQSGPCRHIGSEMYLHPSRPQMHANSASTGELTLLATGLSQLLNEVKWFLLFLTITEFSKPKEKHKTIFHYMRYKVFEI